MLEKILIAGAGLIVLFLVVVAMRAAAYRVERKLEIAAPVDLVFAVLDDLHRFAGVFVLFGSPLDKLDPTMKTTVEGPAAGVGQSYAWSGGKAGTGKLTIEESVPGQKVGVRLEFVKPMASIASLVLTLEGTETGSLVTWTMTGNHNFVGRAFGLFMNMDNMLGADIEKGLVLLKTVAEETRTSA